MKHYSIAEATDFLLLFTGHVSAQNLSNYTGIGESEAIIALRDYAEQNRHCTYQDKPLFNIIQGGNFKPLFKHSVVDALDAFSNELFAKASGRISDMALTSINTPDLEVLSKLTQAISNNNAVNLIYTSLSSGSGSREFVPHKIVNNGLRWHVRGYCRKSQDHRDFVLTRISRVSIRSNDVLQHETTSNDKDWNHALELILVPHPNNITQPTAIEMDYGMVDGQLMIKTNAALVGYLLRRWNIDATENAELKSPEYQLWLKNHRVLKDIENLKIAPGF